MANDTDISETERAREWLDMAQAKWRLQTMQHRSRYNPRTGEYRQLPTRIRRFLNGTPVGMKTAVLAILKESAPYRSPVFDCETDDLVYRPTNTFIRKDGPEHTTGGRDPTYTIIQDLLLDDGQDDALGFADESSCAQAGETEYHWDEPSVEDCPDGGQGVSYQVTDISRDRDTDLFSYRIRRVQSLTVHTAPHVEECDARKRVSVETWDNVYGEPGDFRYDSVRGGSAPIATPAPCAQAGGTTVKTDVSRNPDCTYRITVRTTEAKVDPGAQFSVYRDQYKVNATERTLNAAAPLDRQGVEYRDGVTTRYTSERNEDGTYSNSTETDTERPVASSTVEHRITPRGTRTTRTDSNQPTAADGISSDFGSWKYTKTPGGLYNNEYTEISWAQPGRLGLVCSDTKFAKTHETRSGAAALPPETDHVPPAGGGLVTTWTYDMDDEGFVTWRERTEQEHSVTYAVRRRTWGVAGTTSGYQHRSVSEEAANAVYNAGSTGSSVEIKLTNGGMYDVDVHTFSATSGANLGLECDKTKYQHTHETTTSAASVGDEADDAGGGRSYRRTFSVDPSTGAVTRRDRVTQELHVPQSRRAVRVTARGKTVRATEAGAQAAPDDPAAVGRETEWELNPGGSFNITETQTTPNPENLGEACEQDAFLHTDGTTAVSTSKPNAHVAGGSDGRYAERVSRLGDDGLWETTRTDHQEKEVTGEVHVVVTARGKRKTTITRQTSDQGEEPDADDAGRELRRTMTRGGRWNTEVTTTTARASEMSTECSDDLYLHTHTTGSTTGQKAEAEVAATADKSGVYRARRQQLGDDGLWMVADTTSTEHAVPHQVVDERVTKYGLVTRTTDAQTTDEGTALSATTSDVGKERRVEKTRGGRRNVTKTTVQPLVQKTDESCEKDAFLHTHTTSETLQSKSLTHVDAAGGGKYGGEAWTLTDVGTWERRKTECTEEAPTLDVQKYQDAFGSTSVFEEFSSQANSGGHGGLAYTAGALVRSFEASMTKGRKYNVRTKEETPTEVDSGWLHFAKTTDKGLAVYYDFIVFQNASRDQVDGWVGHIEKIEYTGFSGSFANHPSIRVSPNRFGLWDGTISLTTTFTPKAWAAGGSTEDDNWETPDIKVKSASFVPLSAGKLLKIVTEETHKKGGGVGKDRLRAIIANGVIKGSQFAFHPGGQSFSYDLITAVATKCVVMDMPAGQAATLWNGDTL